MEPNIAVLVTLVWFFVGIVLGLPIWAILLSAGLLGLGLTEGFGLALSQLKSMPYVHTAEYTLIVIPMFIIMGHLAFNAGLSHKAYVVGHKWLSRFPAGLGLATIIACGAFAGACGSSPATAATVGKVAIPEMNALGYDKSLSTGIVAAGGVLGILIPPSICLVFYATLTETSAGKMLISGILPGIVTIIVYSLGVMALAKMNPSLVPATEHYTWKERLISLKDFWGIALLFLVVMGGIYGGICTPSEAAGLGALVALIMMLLAKGEKGSLKEKIRTSLTDTLHTCAMIFLILIGGYTYSFFITLCGIPATVDTWVAGLNVSPMFIVVIFLLFLVPLGMFLDPFSILVISLPISFPVVVHTLGYNALWFGILCTKLVEIALITPPVGLNVYVIAGIAPDVPLTDIFKGASWFIIFDIVVIAILLAFPEVVTFLPNTMR